MTRHHRLAIDDCREGFDEGLSIFGVITMFNNPAWLWVFVPLALLIIAMMIPKHMNEEKDAEEYEERTRAAREALESMNEVQQAGYYLAMWSDPDHNPKRGDRSDDLRLLERKQAEWVRCAIDPEWVAQRSDDVRRIMQKFGHREEDQAT